MIFAQKLKTVQKSNNSLLCVGLDPQTKSLFLFCKKIIDQTYDLVCAYKPNSAFFEGYGATGVEELKKVINYIHKKHPLIPVILDFKRGDIGSTNEGYIKYAFEYLKADAVTIHPYLGQEAVQNFLDYKDKGIIILCKTSNPGSNEFQNLTLPNKRTIYKQVARQVSAKWNRNNNCLLVVGATYPKELKDVRKIVGDDMDILIPGIGAQGGDLIGTLKAGLNKVKRGLIINSSRGIMYAKNPREEALKLREEINKYR
ncbi:MAG: orotidine-5'-phosphate decarboxylase [Microgenomates group bacterium]|jgi:orotidine 5'-phosphate decarboxylase subfamily 2